VDRDLAVFALDHRGHGQSAGRRGHVSRFSDYLSDLDALRGRVSERIRDLPLFLLGHSMGGLIATRYAELYGQGLDGLILSSAALRIEVNEPAIKLALGRLFSKLLPGVTMSNGLDPNHVSRDPEAVRAYVNDPLVHDRVSARWFTEFTAAIEAAQEQAHQLSLPVLVMQSGADRLVAPAGSREFFDRLTVEDKTLKFWEGFFHEMFNEPEKAEVIAFTLDWIEKRLG